MPRQLTEHPAPGKAHEIFLLELVDLPELLIRDVGNAAFPENIIQQIIAPGGGEVAIEHIAHLVTQPGLGVDAIGNGFNRLGIRLEVREKMAPHVIADLTVQLADPIFIARQPDGQDGHAKLLILVTRRREPEVDELIAGNPGLSAVIRKVFSDQPNIKSFVASGDRRVGGKD